MLYKVTVSISGEIEVEAESTEDAESYADSLAPFEVLEHSTFAVDSMDVFEVSESSYQPQQEENQPQ